MTIEPSAEHFPHGADIGVRGIADTMATAFEQAALALTAAVTDPALVMQREMVAIDCAAPDPGLLLADWLNQVIYEMAVRHMLFSRFRVAVDGGRLHGEAWGEAVDVGRHAPAVEPKGATLTALRVARRADGAWIAQCVIDV
jgi:SHS2 domain-containing protein